MLQQDYLEICKALLARIAEVDLNSEAVKNVAVLVRKIDKKKYYLDYEIISKRTLDMKPDKKQKEKMELMPLRKLQEYLQAELDSAL